MVSRFCPLFKKHIIFLLKSLALHRTCYSNQLWQNANKIGSFLSYFFSYFTNTDLLIHSGGIPGVPLCKNVFSHKVNEKFNFPLLFFPSFIIVSYFPLCCSFPQCAYAIAHLQCITNDMQGVSLECALVTISLLSKQKHPVFSVALLSRFYFLTSHNLWKIQSPVSLLQEIPVM